MKILRNQTIKFIIVPFLIFGGAAFGQNLVDDAVERAALWAFYESTNGSEWPGPKWDSTAINNYPNSSLVGVDIQNGDIVSISINFKNMNGTIPEEVSNLTELVELRLTYSFLQNPLPNLQNLQKLETLDLHHNHFTGAVPDWVCTLPSLRFLDLSSYKDGDHFFSGPLPDEISQLTNLEFFYFANNDLSSSESIPNSFSQLENLQGLDLTDCQLSTTSVATGLSNLPGLRNLTLNENPLLVSEDIGTFLGNLPSLQSLILQRNNLKKFPGSSDLFPVLNSLDLSFNPFSSSNTLRGVIDSLKSISTLKTLRLNNCEIDSIPANFVDLSIEVLELNNNLDLIPSQCEELGSLAALKGLYLRNCNIFTLPGSLSNSTTLRILDVTNNNLSSVPEVIKNIPNLTELYLTNNGIATLPTWFGSANMNTLEKLVLRDNRLSILPVAFESLINLTYLDISDNKLNGSWTSDFNDLNKIETLYLNNNEITTLPDLSNWSDLKYIYLQENRLTGGVPTYLTNVSSSKSIVNLSNNDYDHVQEGGNFSGTSGAISLGGNAFTIEDILQLKPSGGSFTTSPQDSIDVKRVVYAPLGGTLTLIAHIDTAASLSSKYQWFKYVEDGNDIPLFISPSHAAREYSLTVNASDQFNKYYYKVTNSSASDLTLTSRLIDLIITCDVNISKVDFEAKTYLCATNLVPDIVYPEGCRTSSYTWDFGDGNTSIDKSPIHVYPDSGTYNVTMDIQYTCGVCISDTTITKSVTFIPSLPELKDSIIQITTDIKSQVISTSAVTFSDAWPLDHKLPISTEDPYALGSAGMWRNDASYVYEAPREISQFLNLSKDGTFELENFSWDYAQLEAIPDWIKANSITKYSPSSNEIENRDVLGNYSAALYDYGEHLPSANGINMHQKEMAFTSFEYPNQVSTGNWIFGSISVPDYDKYKVNIGLNHMAIVEASLEQLQNVEKVDVVSRELLPFFFPFRKRSNLIKDNGIMCMQEHPENPQWTLIVLRKSPSPGLWAGEIRVKNQKVPSASPVIDNLVSHSGKSSLKVVGEKIFAHNLLSLDAEKRYIISLWASIDNQNLLVPKLADNIGLEVILKNEEGSVVDTYAFEPTGNIIDGWQQISGMFIYSDEHHNLELKFKAGSKGTAWFDDLRLHPEAGNMQSYVYDIENFRLQAILDENNYGSFYYYDEEGNLYLTKKETVDGIKTITETVSYMKPVE